MASGPGVASTAGEAGSTAVPPSGWVAGEDAAAMLVDGPAAAPATGGVAGSGCIASRVELVAGVPPAVSELTAVTTVSAPAPVGVTTVASGASAVGGGENTASPVIPLPAAAMGLPPSVAAGVSGEAFGGAATSLATAGAVGATVSVAAAPPSSPPLV